MKKILSTIVAIITLFSFAGVAHASALYFPSVVTSANATTSVTYMTPGTATSTVTYDSFNVNSSNPPLLSSVNTTGAFGAVGFVNYTGSSTASVLQINEEYSTNNIDWYQNTQSLFPPTNSTTTDPINLTTGPTYTYTFASTTVGGAALTATNGATTTLAFYVPTWTRYIRLVLSDKGAAGAVWAAILPWKQNP